MVDRSKVFLTAPAEGGGVGIKPGNLDLRSRWSARRFTQGLSRRDALIPFALALLMVFERRDILETQHRSHAHIRVRDGHDASIFHRVARPEVIAQSGEDLLEVAPFVLSPSKKGSLSIAGQEQ